jgi:hypothetical protein
MAVTALEADRLKRYKSVVRRAAGCTGRDLVGSRQHCTLATRVSAVSSHQLQLQLRTHAVLQRLGLTQRASKPFLRRAAAAFMPNSLQDQHTQAQNW